MSSKSFISPFFFLRVLKVYLQMLHFLLAGETKIPFFQLGVAMYQWALSASLSQAFRLDKPPGQEPL